MKRRLLLQAIVALLLFGVWTGIVRDGIAHGSRESAWIDRRFGDWPAEVHDVQATFDVQFSIFATFAPTAATTEVRGGFPDLFGRPVIGSIVDGDDSQNIYGSRFTTGVRAGALASIAVFVAAPVDEAPHDQFQLAIYDDSDGAPGHRLATTASGRLVPDGWNSLAVRAVLEPRTSYWLMYNSNGTNVAVNNTTFTPVEGNPLDSAIRSHRPARPSRLGDHITSAADTRPMVIAIVILSLLATTRRRRAGIVLLVGFGLALLVAWIVRETMFVPYAYPSGHALRATYVAVAFCLLVSSRAARLAAGLCVALIALTAVRTGGHYSEEILGGVLLGWAMATAAGAFAGDLKRVPTVPVLSANPTTPSIDSPSVIDLTEGSEGSPSNADPLASRGGDVVSEWHPD